MGKLKLKAEKLTIKYRKLELVHSLRAKTANEIAAEIKVASAGFLRSLEWRELRQKVIERYGAKCMCCGYTSNDKSRIHVDHIKPRSLYPSLALDFENLQVLCRACNKAKGNKHSTDYRQKKEKN